MADTLRGSEDIALATALLYQLQSGADVLRQSLDTMDPWDALSRARLLSDQARAIVGILRARAEGKGDE